MDLSVVFWSSSVEGMARGFVYDEMSRTYVCLICGREFSLGFVYPFGDVLCEASKAVELHVAQSHPPIFEYLLELSKRYPGLTELQRDLLGRFYRGESDRSVAQALAIGSTSTVRNHRFKLREKEKQAKVFLALMSLLPARPKDPDELVPVHRGAKMVDDRFAITEQEQQQAIHKYFEADGEGALISWPSREKRKVMVVTHIARRFEPGRKYTEKEVNEVLKAVYADYVTIRRYLIEYGFLDRTRDGSAYWVKV